MEDRARITDVLNDLIRINRDRTEGYHKAIEQLKATDIDLKTMFTNMANSSVQHANALAEEVKTLGGEPVSESTQSGKLYRVWMDIRSTATSHDRRSIIALCEFGEDAALRAYNLALEADVELPTELRQLVEDQKSNIQQSHDTVKRYRDMQEAISSRNTV